MKSGQVSSEFLILVGVIILLTMLFLAHTAEDIKFALHRKQQQALRDIGLSAQQELITAAAMRDGYRREFSLPEKHNEIDYSIAITGTTLVVITADTAGEQSFFVPQVIGNIKKGGNLLRKEHGTIYLN